MTSIDVDLFCGGGSAAHGMRRATGRSPKVAVDFDPHAIATHKAFHPDAEHYEADVWSVDPTAAAKGRPVNRMWLSPSCVDFSDAKTAGVKCTESRALANVGLKWARALRPRVVFLENVGKFTKWGPLGPDGRADKTKAGLYFEAYADEWMRLGYDVDWRKLRASDYGDATDRDRLVMVMRRDDLVQWPEATHGPGLAPKRTAADIIDWDTPVPSLWAPGRRMLADATCRRVAAGVMRYVVNDPNPVRVPGGAACMVQTGYGERKGQAPRVLDLQKPLGTVVAGGQKHGLVLAWVAKHYQGVVGIQAGQPLGTITKVDHHSVVTARVSGGDPARAAAFLVKYYGTAVGQPLDMPLHTVTKIMRFGVVTVAGDPIVDIGMRMLQPRELANAHSLPLEYPLIGTKRDQTARIGNGVPCKMVEAVVRANEPEHEQTHIRSSQ